MKKTLGLAGLAFFGISCMDPIKETMSKEKTSCNIVDIADIELTRYDAEFNDIYDSRWTAHLKNADGEVVGGVDGHYIWFLCEDGRKFKMRNYMHDFKFLEPSYE